MSDHTLIPRSDDVVQSDAAPLKRTSLDEGALFPMGRGRSRAVLSPALGMNRITLNNSHFEDGDEFPQHRHDISEDCMIVLAGAVSFKQGEARTRIAEGDFAWVPIGEVHGTINDSGSSAELISFQSPPDTALYRGDRDKESGEVPVPEGELLALTAAMWHPAHGDDGVVTASNGATEHVEAFELVADEALRIEPDGREHIFVVLRSDGGHIEQADVTHELIAREVWYGVLSIPVTILAGEGNVLGVHAYAL